jgi:hypothetical protein
MEKHNLYVSLKIKFQNFMQYKIIQNLKHICLSSLFITLYSFNYITTSFFDLLFVLYAMYVSINYLFCETSKTNKSRSILKSNEILQLWILNICIMSITNILSYMTNMVNNNVIHIISDNIKCLIYYLLVNNIFPKQQFVNISILLYKINKTGIDSLYELVILFINIVSNSFKYNYTMISNLTYKPTNISLQETVKSPTNISLQETVKSPTNISLQETVKSPTNISLQETVKSPTNISLQELPNDFLFDNDNKSISETIKYLTQTINSDNEPTNIMDVKYE